jgi:hypothetical protein
LGDCPDFNAPSNHAILKLRGDCDAYHRVGYETPKSTTCIGCHAKNLAGASAPSCFLCHGQLWQNTALNPCPEFSPPASHTRYKSEGGCGAYHEPGFERPLKTGCNNCHGANLRGGSGPSCYTCHDNEWKEDDDVPPMASSTNTHPAASSDDIFRNIENIDSDGDGYSNIEEIKALTNPGDPFSLPGGTVVKLKMSDVWKRNWITGNGTMKIFLVVERGAPIDTEQPVTISTKYGKVSTNRLKQRKNSRVKIILPKPMINVLLDSVERESVDVTVSGFISNGEAFSLDKTVKLEGKVPELLGFLKLKANPKELDSIEEVTLTLKGDDLENIDLENKFVAFGIYGKTIVTDVTRSANKITFVLPVEKIEKIVRKLDSLEKTPVCLFNRGRRIDLFAEAVIVKVKSSDDDDGCFDFDPPGDHTIGKTVEDCTYMHAPGMDKPMQNCGLCHGSDLKGTGIAPSCFLCHDSYW